ncbi:MAG: DUF1810 domain-containing protein [Proteobacteria bacterium]|nr:MAG: DUF1810 domain-containing protein [Pseudomonadota bacterium]
MNSDPYDLARFVHAQDPVIGRVHAELGAGRKRSHWMWFVFPQLIGLGSSATARRFAIRSRAEAEHFIRHPLLGPRLARCTRLVNAIDGRTAADIFGFPDYLKFQSSMTLFAKVADEATVYRKALERFFAGTPDSATLELLEKL